jgi:hypothetical protein
MSTALCRTLLLTLTATVFLQAEVGNMSGTWWLNLQRSDWNNNSTPPTSVKLDIKHADPQFEYNGEIERGAGPDHTERFRFAGAIDGKDYPAEQDMGERKIRFTRKSDNVIESYSKFPDGAEERTTTILSGNGKTLTRRVQFKDSQGKTRAWTEVYEKKARL